MKPSIRFLFAFSPALTLVFLLLIAHISLSAQDKPFEPLSPPTAGFGSPKIAGKSVKPVDQLKGKISSDVNTFTGQYTSSYLLGSIATPNVLKFDLISSY
ncbi:MAG: hypothetical protein V4616_14860, partial [Bacteroidota bacterium]